MGGSVALQSFVRPPLAYSPTATAAHYKIVRDYDEVDAATNRIFGRTEVEITLDSSNPSRAQLVPPFAAYVWFRKTGGDNNAPQGELIFERHPLAKSLAGALQKQNLNGATFLACSG